MIKQQNKSPEKKAADVRRLKLGGYGVLICVAAIAIVIIISLIIDALPSSATKKNLSRMDTYKISDDSREFIERIDGDVTLYLVARKDYIDDAFDLYLRKYASLSDHLTVKYVDPDVNPSFVKKYVEGDYGLSDNSVVAVGEKRGFPIDYTMVNIYSVYENGNLIGQIPGDQFNDFLSEYGTYIDEGVWTYTHDFTIENALATAIDYVSVDHLPTIYSLSGHGEKTLDNFNYASIILTNDNITPSSINLALDKNIPDDCDCIVITAPGGDISQDELKILSDYADRGGRIILLSSPGVSEYTNLMSLCASFGLSCTDSVISDPERHYPADESIIIPNINDHEITMEVSAYNIGLADCIGIESTNESGFSITKLLETSSQAYILEEKSKDDTIEGSDDEGELNKVTGRYCVAAISEKEAENGKKSALLWIGSPYLLSDNFIGAFGGNAYFIESSAEYLTDKETTVTIAAKTFADDTLSIDPVLVIVIGIIIALAIPTAIITAGIVINVVRRKRG